ncbi:MAG: hypothetical protein LBL39_03050, partial [Planctomycetaceae bacterium]|nr:hypothetical protein [Planctomycetaceae bacterium]
MLRREFLKSAAAIGVVASGAASTLRADDAVSSPKSKLQFTDNGTFKIVQITDTHYRTDKDFSKES